MTLVAVLVVAASGEAVVDTARAYLGYPYVYGGRGRGFDCSSFVQTVYATHGYHLPRTSRLQAENGRAVPWEALQPGDLLFFSEAPGSSAVTHVGIAVDSQRMIHASTGRAEVVIDPLDMSYYRERRLSARRVLDAPPEAYPPAATQVEQDEPS
ncbi:MAG: C40 family peptidase, partial [Deltaproteobacteria bacterium]|nr:C40 family peptidase [Deltaproteobacteria bacterium]